MTLLDTNESTVQAPIEERFNSLVRRYEKSEHAKRPHYRKVLSEFIDFSPDSDRLIDSLIMHCIAMSNVDRLDMAIDVLSTIGSQIQDYTWKYLQNEINQFSRLYPSDEFRPNGDYWHILLRSMARCSERKDVSCKILSVCQDTKSRSVSESVVESLGDLGTDEAKQLLSHIVHTNDDAFVRELATEVLQDF